MPEEDAGPKRFETPAQVPRKVPIEPREMEPVGVTDGRGERPEIEDGLGVEDRSIGVVNKGSWFSGGGRDTAGEDAVGVVGGEGEAERGLEMGVGNLLSTSSAEADEVNLFSWRLSSSLCEICNAGGAVAIRGTGAVVGGDTLSGRKGLETMRRGGDEFVTD